MKCCTCKMLEFSLVKVTFSVQVNIYMDYDFGSTNPVCIYSCEKDKENRIDMI